MKPTNWHLLALDFALAIVLAVFDPLMGLGAGVMGLTIAAIERRM